MVGIFGEFHRFGIPVSGSTWKRKVSQPSVSLSSSVSGAPEQQRMRIAISGSGLPPDNPLVLEAGGRF